MVFFNAHQFTSYAHIFKNFLTYSLSAIILRSLTAITSLLALRVIEPAQFGLLALINSFVAIAPIFFSLGLRQAFWLEYFHKTSTQRKIIFNHIVAAYLCIATPLFMISLLRLDAINHYIFLDQANRCLITIALVYCFVQFFSELFLQVLRNQMKALVLATVQLSAAMVTIALSVFLVFYAQWGIVGIVYANTFGIILIAVVGLCIYLRTQVYTQVTRVTFLSNTAYLLRLGFPFIPSMILMWLLAAGNRWILAYIGTMQQVGIYSLADIAGQVFNLCILTPLNAAYVPYMFQQYATHRENIVFIEQRNIQTMKWAMGGACIVVAIGTAAAFVLAPYVLPFLYQQAVQYVWFIGMANVLLMGTCFSSCIIFYYKKTWWVLAMNAIAVLTNIGLNFLLIPWLHIYGCVIASIMAHGFFFYFNWIMRKKLLLRHTLPEHT